MCGAGLSASPPLVWLLCDPARFPAGSGWTVAAFCAWIVGCASAGIAGKSITKVAKIRGLIEVILLFNPSLEGTLSVPGKPRLRHCQFLLYNVADTDVQARLTQLCTLLRRK